METVFICHNYSDNSFASASKYLAEHLAQSGYKVVFLSHKPRGLKGFKEGDLTVIPWPVQGRPTTVKAALFFIKTYLNYKPKYIIGHFGGAVLPSILSTILSFGKTKVFNVYHTLTWQNKMDYDDGSLRVKLQNARRAWFYRMFISEIIAPSNAAKADYKENWPPKKVNVIYNGYKTLNIEKDVTQAYERRILVFLGRLDVSKGVVQLIDAFQKYIADHPNTRLSLSMVGQAQEGVLPEIKSDKIRLNGVVTYDKVPKIISEAFFMITPSLMDNLPTVGIEALSYYTPIVASNKGGWPEIVDDKINGLSIEPSVEEIYKALELVDSLTVEEYEHYCKNARKKYEERFVLEHYAEEVQKLLV